MVGLTLYTRMAVILRSKLCKAHLNNANVLLHNPFCHDDLFSFARLCSPVISGLNLFFANTPTPACVPGSLPAGVCAHVVCGQLTTRIEPRFSGCYVREPVPCMLSGVGLSLSPLGCFYGPSCGFASTQEYAPRHETCSGPV